MNKILMIEEEPSMVQAAQERLSHAGFELFSAQDGYRGFQMVKEKVPDLIITDAFIPLMSGFELCKAIKLDEAIKSIPIVVLTEMHRLEESFMFLGISDFLNKPLNMDELESVVKGKLKTSQNMGTLKNKILINGKPEILTCCQELLKDNPYWSEYYSYNNEAFIRDAVKYVPDVILIDLLMTEIAADDMVSKLKSKRELRNAVILTYYPAGSTSRDPLAIQAQMIEVQYMKRLTQEAGALEYIGPFNPDTFLHLIDIYKRKFNYII